MSANEQPIEPAEGGRTITVSVNLDALRSGLQRDIQTTINLITLSMQGEVAAVDAPIHLPTQGMKVTFDARIRWDANEARERRNSWLLANGVRDCIESLSVLLEDANKVLAFWAMMEKHEDGIVGVAEYEEMHGRRAEKFHELGLPHKITFLEKTYGIAIDLTLASQIVSINDARNCLVHRRGLVSQKDVGTDGFLRIKWRSFQGLFIAANGVEQPLRFDEVMVGPGTIALRVTDQERVFEIGQQLVFSAEDLADMCWGLYLFGEEVVQLLSKHGLEHGFLIPRQEMDKNPSFVPSAPPLPDR